jgi:putative transposase
MVTPAVRREAVVHLCKVHGVSQRRACDVLQIDRSTVRYLSRRGDDVELRDANKRVSRERRRFGCRRIHVMISREGFGVTSRTVVWLFLKQFRFECVPVLHSLQGRLAA